MPQEGMIRLSTRDKNLRKRLILSDAELAADTAQSGSMRNIEMLMQEMNLQKDPKKKNILMEEYNRILEATAPFVPEGPITKAAEANKPSADMSFLDKILSVFK